MKRPFYKKKRFWILFLLLTVIVGASIPLILDPLNNFRVATGYVLRLFGVKEKRERIGKYRFHYYEGGSDHEQTVLLLHGFGGNALLTWMQLLPPLAKRYHVYAPDMLASNFLALNPKKYSVGSEVEMILKFMDGMKIKKADLVGLSVGGWVSLLIALDHPERVNRLILVESAGLTTEVPELARLTLTDRQKAKHFLELLFHYPPPLPGFVLDALVKSSLKIKPKYLAVFQGFIRNSTPLALDDRLDEISQPTLIIHGKDDQVIPLDVAERLHQGLPNSKLVVFENSGHAVVWDSPWALRRNILSFLKSDPKQP